MKMRNAAVTGAILGAVVFGVAAPSFASGSTSTAGSGVIANGPGTRSVSANADAAVLAKLNALKRTQPAAEVQKVLDSGKPVQSLFDPVSGKYVAAYADGSRMMKPLTISPRGPGCAVGDACAITTSSVPYGFYGTGSLPIYVPSAHKAEAGSRLTTFWYSSTHGIYIQAGNTVTLSSPRTFTKITRS